jgi:hypothetical protein
MGIFTTDHPLASQPSCFDAKAHPIVSYICQAFATALVLLPFVCGYVLYSAFTDPGPECTDFPPITETDPGRFIVFSVVGSFAFCLICALLMAFLFRLFLRCAHNAFS